MPLFPGQAGWMEDETEECEETDEWMGTEDEKLKHIFLATAKMPSFSKLCYGINLPSVRDQVDQYAKSDLVQSIRAWGGFI